MIEIKRVTRTSANVHEFRYVARESCGESCQPPESDRLLFAYSSPRHGQGQREVVGVACYHAAGIHQKEVASAEFLDGFYHTITYLFVKPYHKGQGVGTKMLEFIVREMKQRAKRPIRLQSAEKAVRFFQRGGFTATGDVIDCVCGGSPLFSRLVNMELNIS